jgi:hypothetical protein
MNKWSLEEEAQMKKTNGNNLAELVAKARCAQMFAKVLNSKKRRSEVVVPGTDGKQYTVILKWIQIYEANTRRPALRSECLINTGIGTKPCKGNGVSLCYHVIAAVAKLAETNNKEISFCHNQDIARKLSNIGGNHFRIISTQSNTELWAVARSQ